MRIDLSLLLITLCITLSTFKILGLLHCSWVVALSPIWFPASLIIALFIASCFIVKKDSWIQ